MELLNNLRLITLPKWLTYLIVVIIAIAVCFNGFLLYTGFTAQADFGWVGDAISLVGTLLPLVLLILVLAFSNTGVASLVKKTEKILVRHLPEQLAKVPDCLNGTTTIQLAKAEVSHNHQQGLCYCDYQLQFNQQTQLRKITYFRIILRVEINVRKVNVNIYLPETVLQAQLMANPQLTTYEDVLNLFKHSKSGAEGIQAQDNRQINYHFNDRLIKRCFNGQAYYCLVASALVNDDLLWDASEILYFTQDLMFMVRSFYTENPEFFVEKTIDD